MVRPITAKDEILIKKCAEGDTDAFDLLFKKYARPLTFFIEQIIKDRQRAEDIFQDTFIKVLQKIDTFDNRFRFSTWIYRIALNLSLNELKRASKVNSFPTGNSNKDDERSINFEDYLREENTPYSTTERKDRLEQVSEAIEHIPGPKKVAFMLKFYHNLSYEEIADITGSSVGTIKSRIHYAVKQLKALVGE